MMQVLTRSYLELWLVLSLENTSQFSDNDLEVDTGQIRDSYLSV